MSRGLRAIVWLATLVIVASLTLIALGPSVPAQASRLVRNGAEALAFLGLWVGCLLVVGCSRHYMLGVPGIAVRSFVAMMLATLAGTTLYLASTGRVAPVATAALSGARGDHLGTTLALLGFVAALLLTATSWSSQRRWAEPLLITAAVGLPLGALAHLHALSQPATPGSQAGSPLVVMTVVAGLLLGPIRIASAIGWVSGSVHVGSLTARRYLENGPLRVAIVVGQPLWLVLGVTGALPVWLGGRFGAWALIRGTPIGTWLVACAVTALASLYVWRRRGLLEVDEAISASYASTSLLYYIGLAVATLVFMLAAHFAVRAAIPQALPTMGVVTVAFFALAGVLWYGFKGSRTRETLIGVLGIASVLVIVAGGARWPSAHAGIAGGSYTTELRLSLVGRVLDSSFFLAAVTGFLALLYFGFWASVRVAKRRFAGAGAPPSGEDAYLTAVVPLACWLGVVAAGAALRTVHFSAANGFIRPVAPDPVLIAITAFPVVAFFVLRPSTAVDDIRRLSSTTLIVLPALAFLPFAVPATLRPGGRLVVFALAAPLVYSAVFDASTLNREPGRKRRIGWYAGVGAISLPLVAYAIVVMGQRDVLSALATDDGRAGAGEGPIGHLRLILLLPLLLTLVCADRPAPPARVEGLRPSRWRDFESDFVMGSVAHADWDETYQEALGRHLPKLSPVESVEYAVAMARRLIAHYPVPGPNGDEARPWPHTFGQGARRWFGWYVRSETPTREEARRSLEDAAALASGRRVASWRIGRARRVAARGPFCYLDQAIDGAAVSHALQALACILDDPFQPDTGRLPTLPSRDP